MSLTRGWGVRRREVAKRGQEKKGKKQKNSGKWGGLKGKTKLKGSGIGTIEVGTRKTLNAR